MKNFLLLLIALLLFPLALSAQEQCDFDGDGTSDYLYLSSSGTSLVWNVKSSPLSTTIESTTFGLTTDKIAPARWLSADSSSLGIVRLDSENKKLIWKVYLKDTGLLQEESFGKSDSVFLSGGDFDGNGIADAAVVTQGKRGLKWLVRLNMFSPDEQQRKTIQFQLGKNGDRVMYLNPEGEKDWAGVFGKNKRGGAILTLRNLSTKKKKIIKKISRSFLNGGNTRPRPFPIKSADGSDYIGFLAAPSNDPTDAKLTVYDLSGKETLKVSFGGLGTFAVGNFNPSDEGEEIIFQTLTKMHVVNPFSGVDTQATPFGSALQDEVSIENVAGPTPIPTSTPVATATATAVPTI